MTDFRGNIDHWLRQSEPDYYLFFLKAWIPFNAWYVAELPHLEKKDNKIIKELQDHPRSRPRSIIENYLVSNSYEAKNFRQHLAELHYYLDHKSVHHNGTKISFKNLALTQNPITFEKDIDNRGNIYKSEVKNGYFESIVVDKGRRTILHIKQPKFSLTDIEKHNDYIKLGDKKMQAKVLNCSKSIDPNKTISLVSNTKNKGSSIYLEGPHPVNFIKDPTTIAKGCLSILYSLRCMLFHGEIEPTQSSRPIYEHSYYLLRFILKEI